jgi:hypothetical protein
MAALFGVGCGAAAKEVAIFVENFLKLIPCIRFDLKKN